MKTMTKFHFKRHNWDVKTRPQDSPPPLEADSQLAKLISLRHFECEVARNIKQALETLGVVDDLKVAYMTFINDENKHDAQLLQLAKHYGVEDVVPPEEIMAEYRSIKEQYDPIIVNFMLEQIFIVSLPQMQKQGDVFANFCAAWILLDEAVHILLGRYMLNALGLKIDERIITFAMDVLSWLGLGEKQKKTLLHNLVTGASSSSLVDQQLVTSPRISFFEHKEVSYGV